MKAKEFGKRAPWWLPAALTFGPWCLALGHIVGGQNRNISFGVALVGAVLVSSALLWVAHNLVAVTVALEKTGAIVSLETPKAVWVLAASVAAGVLFFNLYI